MHNRLKNYRKKLGLSQEFVASQLNISRSTLSLIEAGKRKVKTEELPLFAALYNVSLEALIKGGESASNTEDLNKVFNNLSEEDKREVIQFIQFKSQNSRK